MAAGGYAFPQMCLWISRCKVLAGPLLGATNRGIVLSVFLCDFNVPRVLFIVEKICPRCMFSFLLSVLVKERHAYKEIV